MSGSNDAVMTPEANSLQVPPQQSLILSSKSSTNSKTSKLPMSTVYSKPQSNIYLPSSITPQYPIQAPTGGPIIVSAPKGILRRKQ